MSPLTADSRVQLPRAKRIFDLGAAAVLLVITLPAVVVLSMLICWDRGPLLYGHVRIGYRGRAFRCWKFRSMRPDGDRILAAYLKGHPATAEEWVLRRKLRRDPRVTAVGRFLRATSIDELPQLINVLRGDMSLVGPRPVTQEELDTYYGPCGRAAYVSVRPGLTGLWQVNGRSGTTYAERVAMDAQYVASVSFLGDLKLLLRTIPAVLRRDGAV